MHAQALVWVAFLGTVCAQAVPTFTPAATTTTPAAVPTTSASAPPACHASQGLIGIHQDPSMPSAAPICVCIHSAIPGVDSFCPSCPTNASPICGGGVCGCACDAGYMSSASGCVVETCSTASSSGLGAPAVPVTSIADAQATTNLGSLPQSSPLPINIVTSSAVIAGGGVSTAANAAATSSAGAAANGGSAGSAGSSASVFSTVVTVSGASQAYTTATVLFTIPIPAASGSSLAPTSIADAQATTILPNSVPTQPASGSAAGSNAGTGNSVPTASAAAATSIVAALAQISQAPSCTCGNTIVTQTTTVTTTVNSCPTSAHLFVVSGKGVSRVVQHFV